MIIILSAVPVCKTWRGWLSGSSLSTSQGSETWQQKTRQKHNWMQRASAQHVRWLPFLCCHLVVEAKTACGPVWLLTCTHGMVRIYFPDTEMMLLKVEVTWPWYLFCLIPTSVWVEVLVTCPNECCGVRYQGWGQPYTADQFNWNMSSVASQQGAHARKPAQGRPAGVCLAAAKLKPHPSICCCCSGSWERRSCSSCRSPVNLVHVDTQCQQPQWLFGLKTRC